jgi:hypothetical protein
MGRQEGKIGGLRAAPPNFPVVMQKARLPDLLRVTGVWGIGRIHRSLLRCLRTRSIGRRQQSFQHRGDAP